MKEVKVRNGNVVWIWEAWTQHYLLTFGKWSKNKKEDHTSIRLVLTKYLSPRDFQDEKILPKHPKFNPKLNPYLITIKITNKINEDSIWSI